MELTLKTLAAFPDQLEAHFALFSDAQQHWLPSSWDTCPSEHYSALEQICHVRDIETDGYHVRFARTLAEDRPFLPGVDGDALKIERHYAAADPAEVFTAFRTARVKTLDLLSGLSVDQWQRPADFEDYGPTTMAGLAHYLCSYDQQHLAGLQWLLGQMQAS
jgi:hypothetical protein